MIRSIAGIHLLVKLIRQRQSRLKKIQQFAYHITKFSWHFRIPSSVLLVRHKFYFQGSTYHLIFERKSTKPKEKKMQINHEISPLPSVVVAQRPVQDWWTLDPCCHGHKNTPGPSGHAPPRAHPRGPSYAILYHTGNTAHCPLDLQTIKYLFVTCTCKYIFKVIGLGMC